MPEHQETEWKESWRDDYLKWLCGYANAHGSMLFISCFPISSHPCREWTGDGGRNHEK